MTEFAFSRSAGTMARLRADLERQFALEGQPGKRASVLQLCKRGLHPRFLPLIFARLSRATFLKRIPGVPFVFSYLNLVLFGLQITPRCEIGPGLFLPHTSGTVIGAWRIGRNVTLFQQVTLGAKEVDTRFTRDLLPEIGDDVTIGAGAKVLGGIQVADGAVVGANAVVVHSVEPGCTVAGIPARKINATRSSIGEQRAVSVGFDDHHSQSQH